MCKTRTYENRCKQDSIKIAKAFMVLLKSEWTDKDYEKYKKVVKATGIPDKQLGCITDEVTKTGGNYRLIDIYQFWG